MKVKIGEKIYDSKDQPIMVILTEKDKVNIIDLDPKETKYIEYTGKEMSKEEVDKWSEGVDDKKEDKKEVSEKKAPVKGPGGHIPDGTGPHGRGMGPGGGKGDGSGMKDLEKKESSIKTFSWMNKKSDTVDNEDVKMVIDKLIDYYEGWEEGHLAMNPDRKKELYEKIKMFLVEKELSGYAFSAKTDSGELLTTEKEIDKFFVKSSIKSFSWMKKEAAIDYENREEAFSKVIEMINYAYNNSGTGNLHKIKERNKYYLKKGDVGTLADAILDDRDEEFAKMTGDAAYNYIIDNYFNNEDVLREMF